MRAHTTAEIARLLGIRRQAVQLAERNALQHLRALAAGEATVSMMATRSRATKTACTASPTSATGASYTIYCTQQGRCCIHGKQGCLRLRGKFVCFPTLEDAKNLVKRFRTEGYTSYDSMERSLPEWEYMCLNWREQQRSPTLLRSMQRVS